MMNANMNKIGNLVNLKGHAEFAIVTDARTYTASSILFFVKCKKYYTITLHFDDKLHASGE